MGSPVVRPSYGPARIVLSVKLLKQFYKFYKLLLENVSKLNLKNDQKLTHFFSLCKDINNRHLKKEKLTKAEKLIQY